MSPSNFRRFSCLLDPHPLSARVAVRRQVAPLRALHAPMSPTMRFALVYVLALVVSLAVWFFYRSVYEDDTSFLVPIVISLVTSYVCAHALTGGKSPRN